MYRTTILVLAILASSCIRAHTDPVTGKTDVDVENPLKKGEDWSGTLKGMNQWAAITGAVTARVIQGETTVSISMKGATPGAVHPWHLHDGSCASGGPIAGSASAYAPLTVGTNGTAEGTARIAGTLNEAKPYHVNVHASAGELSTIIACADIKD